MFCSSKNPYGNKTTLAFPDVFLRFCSSKNPYGNKTGEDTTVYVDRFCSSKNPYGNKTECAKEHEYNQVLF